MRENTHTPSPDTPPISVSQPLDFDQPLQQSLQQRVEVPMNYKPWENNSSHSTNQGPLVQLHSPSAGDFSRPLSLNLNNEETNKLNVKAVQKEAVLSYVKAKTSPSSVAQPPPFRSPATDLLSPSLPCRSIPAVPSLIESTIIAPPYRPPPADPSNVLGNRKGVQTNTGPMRLSRQNSLSNNTNGDQTPPPSNLQPHTAATASFTVRREMERQREEIEQIQHLRQVTYHTLFVLFH